MSLNSSPNETSDIILEFGVKQKMCDGVLLSSDIYRPAKSDEKFPAIITRTPYMTVEGFQKRFAKEAEFFVRNGYVFIVQDCRGKNDSGGEFHPFFDDPQDGFDTLNWCSKQEWSNGSFGTTGASYQAWNQWGTAALHPPGLKAMVCTVSLPDPVINVPFQNGALVLWMSEWMAMVEGKRNTDPSIYDSLENYWHLPLETLDQTFGRKSLFWKNWIEHPSADDYWKKSFYQNKFGEIDLPVLHISGWYDDDLIGTHINYVGMKEKSASEKTRQNQKLIIGPWPHHVNGSRTMGDIDFGETALIDLQKTKLDWFDYWLKEIDTGIMTEPAVDIFVMGKNSWKKIDEWPLRNTKYTELYLRSGGRANTVYGDGKLSSSKPSEEESFDAYSYDPRNPCPNIFDTSITPAEGPFDQRPIERRDDVLVYSTDPMERDLEVSGPVRVKLYASTSARDTDFWAQLVDVFPNGYSMHLTEGILRGRYRKSLETPELLEPQEIYAFNIDLWIISNLFLKGHSIKLHISSSSFPKYDRNPNTGHEFGRDTDLLTAHQKIYHNGEFPSYILLPFIDGSL